MNTSTNRAGMALLLMALGGAVAGLAQASEAADTGRWQPGVYADAQVQGWSNGLPLLDFDGNWAHGYEPRRGMQRAYLAGRAEAGISLAPAFGGRRWPVRVGAVQRAEALVAMSGEAAQVVYHYQSRIDPEGAVTYDAGHRSLIWQGQGLALHADGVGVGPLRMSARLELLRLDRLRRTASAGRIGYDGLGTYSYAVAVQDDADRTRAPFMSAPAGSGQGHSLSLGVQWQPVAAWTLSAHVDDAWSRLRWRGIHSDRSTLDSNVASRTPEGYIDYKPALQGAYTRRTLCVEIPRTVRAQAVWHRPEGDWSLRLHRRWGLQQAWLGWQGLGAVRWMAAVEPHARALQLGLTWRGLQAAVMADRLDEDAHVAGAALSWQLAF